MDKTTHEMRLMHWASIIDECRNSCMIVRSWCHSKNVNTSQFYYWERRVNGKQFETLKELNLTISLTLYSYSYKFLLNLQETHLPLVQV